MKVRMRAILFAIMTLMATLAPAAASAGHWEQNVGDFDSLIVTDEVNVVYRCDPSKAGKVIYDGDEEFADAFILTNNGKGALRIQVNTEDIGKPALPTLYVYSSLLKNARNESDFSLTLENLPEVERLRLKVIGNGKISAQDVKCHEFKAHIATGNGTIAVSGTTDKAEYTMVGTGCIQADKLKSGSVNCTIFGGGQIGCWATDKLKSKGLGSTKIYYRGTPRISKSGGGKLVQISAALASKLPNKTEGIEHIAG